MIAQIIYDISSLKMYEPIGPKAHYQEISHKNI